MTAPVITIRRFFSTTQIVAHEDFLAVLDSGFGQDRLRRVHYADISRVVYGTAPTVGFAVLYVALSVIGMLSIAVWSQPVFGVLVLAPCGFMAALAILRGKTVFVFESGGREWKYAKNFLRGSKRIAFLNAVLDHMEREQKTRPLLFVDAAEQRPETDSPFVPFAQQ